MAADKAAAAVAEVDVAQPDQPQPAAEAAPTKRKDLKRPFYKKLKAIWNHVSGWRK